MRQKTAIEVILESCANRSKTIPEIIEETKFKKDSVQSKIVELSRGGYLQKTVSNKKGGNNRFLNEYRATDKKYVIKEYGGQKVRAEIKKYITENRHRFIDPDDIASLVGRDRYKVIDFVRDMFPDIKSARLTNDGELIGATLTNEQGLYVMYFDSENVKSYERPKIRYGNPYVDAALNASMRYGC